MRWTLIFIALQLCSVPAHALPEVWLGSSESPNVQIFDTDGTILGPFPTERGTVGALEIVGSEIWMGSGDSDYVRRLDFDGNVIGEFRTLIGATGGIALVGDSVWIGSAESLNVRRFDLSGNMIDTFTNNVGSTGAMTFVPEPSTTSLLALGLVGIAVVGRRRVN